MSIRRELKPVTKIWPKCRICVQFRENSGDCYCKHKGHWFEAYNESDGSKVVRTMITYHKIAYCRKHKTAQPEQITMFKEYRR